MLLKKMQREQQTLDTNQYTANNMVLEPDELVEKCRQLVEEVLGVVVFGSYARGTHDNLSDLDLAIITSSREVSYKYFTHQGIDVDAFILPRSFFDELVVELEERVTHTLWITHTLYLKIIREGMILYDPNRILMKWKDTLSNWKWVREDIALAVEYLYDNVELAGKLFEREELLKAIVALRTAADTMITVKTMEASLIPSPRPQDLYYNARRLGLNELYRKLQGLDEDETNIRKLLASYKPMVNDDSVKRLWKKTCRELARGNNEVALMEARNLVLMEKSITYSTSKPKPYDASSRLKVVEKMSRDEVEFIEKLHGINYNSRGYLENMFETISSVCSMFSSYL